MRFKPKMSITYNSLNLPSSMTYSDGTAKNPSTLNTMSAHHQARKGR